MNPSYLFSALSNLDASPILANVIKRGESSSSPQPLALDLRSNHKWEVMGGGTELTGNLRESARIEDKLQLATMMGDNLVIAFGHCHVCAGDWCRLVDRCCCVNSGQN